MKRHTAFGLVLAMSLGCGQLDPTTSKDNVTGWVPLDEQTFQQLPVWDGVLDLDVTYGINDYHTRTFGAGITGQNVGTTRFTGSANPNHWHFRAYVTPDRAGDPLWRGWTLQRRGFALAFDMGPGDKAWLAGGQLRFPVDSLQPGTYYFTASLAFHQSAAAREPEMRTPFFDAGEFELIR